MAQVYAETRHRAYARPPECQDLFVHVGGYSDHFVDLGRDLQDEIIAHTEQTAF